MARACISGIIDRNMGENPKVKKGYKQLLAEANAIVETLSVAEAAQLVGNDDVQFVDIRDVRELKAEGKMPGAVHAPRGMLEFWVDPESPYYREVFAQDPEQPKRFVFFCAAGWRSALAVKSLMEMGMENICHVDGGFSAWKEAGQPVDLPPPVEDDKN